jgi:hypothetical protein
MSGFHAIYDDINELATASEMLYAWLEHVVVCEFNLTGNSVHQISGDIYDNAS